MCRWLLGNIIFGIVCIVGSLGMLVILLSVGLDYGFFFGLLAAAGFIIVCALVMALLYGLLGIDPMEVLGNGGSTYSKEEAKDYARSYLGGSGYYDTNDAMTEVEAAIDNMEGEISYADVANMAQDAADRYNNYSSQENVPSRYNGGNS